MLLTQEAFFVYKKNIFTFRFPSFGEGVGENIIFRTKPQRF